MRKHNAEVQRAINNYNRIVRQYNAQVRQNRQIINREIAKFNSTIRSATSYSASVRNLQCSYSTVIATYTEGSVITPDQNNILDLIEQEQANSIITANVVENNIFPEEDTADVDIINKLNNISEDLGKRWQGAIFALNPINPDALRHFCTSTREILVKFIELKAPDSEVILYNPNCDRTENDKSPTYKEKIKYMLRNRSFDESIVNFIDCDIKDIVELIRFLSGGTHGPADKFSMKQLQQAKKRVEHGINFLYEISA